MNYASTKELESAVATFLLFEGREALYKERDTFVRVRLTKVRAGKRGIAAIVNVLPTPGFPVAAQSSWEIGTVWPLFSYSEDRWSMTRFERWELLFQSDAIVRVQETLLALPGSLPSNCRREILGLVLEGRIENANRMISLFRERESRYVLDAVARQEAVAVALAFNGREAMFSSGEVLAKVVVTDVGVDERGIWGSASLLPTPNLGTELTNSSKWPIGDCWRCLYISEDKWQVLCAQDTVLQFDPSVIRKVVGLCEGDLRYTAPSLRAKCLGEFIRGGGEDKLEQQIAQLKQIRSSRTATSEKARPFWSALRSRFLSAIHSPIRKRRKITKLGYSFEVD